MRISISNSFNVKHISPGFLIVFNLEIINFGSPSFFSTSNCYLFMFFFNVSVISQVVRFASVRK